MDTVGCMCCSLIFYFCICLRLGTGANMGSVIHRADYHAMLLEKAKSLGAVIRLDAEVVGVNSDNTYALLASGEKVNADVIIGADGMFTISL